MSIRFKPKSKKKHASVPAPAPAPTTPVTTAPVPATPVFTTPLSSTAPMPVPTSASTYAPRFTSIPAGIPGMPAATRPVLTPAPMPTPGSMPAFAHVPMIAHAPAPAPARASTRCNHLKTCSTCTERASNESASLLADCLNALESLQVEKSSLERDVTSLEEKIEQLTAENARLTVELRDSGDNNTPENVDQRNATVLRENVHRLQIALANFTMVRGRKAQIQREGMDGLFAQYGLDPETTDYKDMACAVLQRFVLDMVRGCVDVAYRSFVNPADDATQGKREGAMPEFALIQYTVNLARGLKQFVGQRAPKDKHLLAQATKIRRDLYSTLGTHGFPDDHQLVRQIAEKLESDMEKYRVIEDPQKRAHVLSNAQALVRDIISTFYIHRFVQSNVPEVRFFQAGTAVNETTMDFDEAEDQGPYAVALCYFPLIINTETKTPHCVAKVLTKPMGKISPRNSPLRGRNQPATMSAFFR